MVDISTLQAQERQRFIQTHPASMAQAAAARRHYLFGVPLHWMRDWPSPATLAVAQAQGVTLTCADGLTYTDFCLGDTGAMFGHSPAPLAQALAAQAARGLTSMLPAEHTPEVGALLAATFGLPLWQMGDSFVAMSLVVFASLVAKRYLPSSLPAFAYATIIGILICLPETPVRGLFIDAVAKISFLSCCVPLLAFAGLSVGGQLEELKKMSWKVILIFMVLRARNRRRTTPRI